MNTRNTLRRHGLLLALMLCSAASQAEVWKCKAADGSTVFSDRPCPGSGTALDSARLRGNAIEGPRPGAASAPEERPADTAAVAAPLPANDCPGDQEIRHMETRASSTSLGEKERAFMQDEIRRARQCRKGQGRYSAADWAISREAQAAQSNLSGAAEARRRAEGMHSAADPAEGERIAQQRLAEERAERQLTRLQQLRAQPLTPPCPASVPRSTRPPHCR